MKPFLFSALILFTAASAGGLSPLPGVETEPEDSDSMPLPKTVIESDHLELKTSAEENIFLFEGNVRVEGTNLTAVCDRMEVTASRTADSDPDAAFGQVGAITHIAALGNVVISQANRTAEAGRADIYPREGKVILTEKPRVTDERGMVATGTRMVLLQGERRVIIEGEDGEDVSGDRPRVTLPSLPDMGFDRDTEDPEAGDVEENPVAEPKDEGENPSNGGEDDA